MSTQLPVVELTQTVQYHINKLNEFFTNSIKDNDNKITRLIITNGQWLLKRSVRSIFDNENNVELDKFIINIITEGIYNLNVVMIKACLYSNIKKVKLMIKHGANDWNQGLHEACYSGCIEIVELMIKHGANDFNEGLCKACLKGHMEIAELVIKHGANNWNEGLYYACYNGHQSLVELMIKHGATDWNGGLSEACDGCVEIIEHNTNNSNEELIKSYIIIIKLMIKHGATNFDEVFKLIFWSMK